ncbi:MAG: hypothetical protein ACYCOU_19570 [Sulfobacillus sp.]
MAVIITAVVIAVYFAWKSFSKGDIGFRHDLEGFTVGGPDSQVTCNCTCSASGPGPGQGSGMTNGSVNASPSARLANLFTRAERLNADRQLNDLINGRADAKKFMEAYQSELGSPTFHSDVAEYLKEHPGHGTTLETAIRDAKYFGISQGNPTSPNTGINLSSANPAGPPPIPG